MLSDRNRTATPASFSRRFLFSFSERELSFHCLVGKSTSQAVDTSPGLRGQCPLRLSTRIIYNIPVLTEACGREKIIQKTNICRQKAAKFKDCHCADFITRLWQHREDALAALVSVSKVSGIYQPCRSACQGSTDDKKAMKK